MVEVNENNSIFEVLDMIPSLFKDDLNILIKENKMFHDLLHDLLLYHPNGEETFSKKLTNEQIDKLNDFVYQYNLDKDGEDLTVDIEFLK